MSKGRMRRGALAALIIAALAAATWFVLPAVRISVAERTALAQLGRPYIFGAAGPESFDCSGLTKYAYARAGVELAHNTRAVAGDVRYRTVSEPADFHRGDLIYFDTVGNSDIDHVGLWLGGNRFVHASSAQGAVVVSDFDEKWKARFVLAKRVV